MNPPHHVCCGEPPFDGGLELSSVAALSYVMYIAASIVMSSILAGCKCKSNASVMQVDCKTKSTTKCNSIAIDNLC